MMMMIVVMIARTMVVVISDHGANKELSQICHCVNE